jgi:hypothetical protein
MAMVFIDFSDEYEGIDILTLFLQYTFGRRTINILGPSSSLNSNPKDLYYALDLFKFLIPSN